MPRSHERQHAADRGERHAGEDARRVRGAPEASGRAARGSAPAPAARRSASRAAARSQVLELAAERDVVARRAARPALSIALPRLGDEAADVAAAHVGLDDDPPLAPLAVDGRRPLDRADRAPAGAAGRARPLARRDRGSAPSAVGVAPVAARRARTAIGKRRSPSCSDPDLARAPSAATTSSTSRAGMPWRASASRSTSICEHRLPGDLLGDHVGRARDRASGRASISRAFALSTSKSSPKSFTPTSRADAGDHLVDPHLDRLGEDHPHARAGRASSRSMHRATSSSCVRARFHRSRGLSVMKMSESSRPIGSVATSAVPVRVQTRSISSGNVARSAFSICVP